MDDIFGSFVSVSGNVAIVGAPGDDTAVGMSAGSAYIYRFNSVTGSWVEEAHLLASDGAMGDQFGVSVSISGNIAIVGAHQDDTGVGRIDSGSAYIYRFGGVTWIQEQHLIASDGAAGDSFGRSVSISGEVAIVGAVLWDDTMGKTDTGSAYIYRCNGTNWVEEHIFASDGAPGDQFGISVSISGDVAIVGAWTDNTGGGGLCAGSAYIYRFDRVKVKWIQEKHLFASDGTSGDAFGESVSINVSDKWDVAIVGASSDDTAAGGLGAGSAYIYRFDDMCWSEEQHLFASDGAGGDRFGISVSISVDDAIVGASNDDTANGIGAGSAYVYRFNGINWNEVQHLFASDGADGDGFGPVAIDGETAIVGTFGDDTPAGVDAGSAYIFSGISNPGFTPFDPPNKTLAQGAPNILATSLLDTIAGPPGSPPTNDIAVVIPVAINPANPGSVQIFLNNGTVGGVWQNITPLEVLPAGADPTGIALGALDDDAFPDIAVTNAGDENIMIYINTGLGDGSFNLPITFSMNPGEAPQAIAAGDFTGDGLTDLAVVNVVNVVSCEPDNLVILENLPGSPGTFVRGQTLPLGMLDGPRDIDPADKDNDKDLDLLVTNFGSNTVSILDFNAGLFSLQSTLPVGLAPTDAAVGDLDGNGFADVAVVNSDGTATIILNSDGSTFTQAFLVPVGALPRAIDVGDFDFDGDLDLVVAADDAAIGPAVQVFENFLELGVGLTFGPANAESVNADPNFVVTALINDDNKSDVVTVNEDTGVPTGGSVTVLLSGTLCPGDITPTLGGNGVVNIDDLITLLGAFGPCPAFPLPCPADISPEDGGNGVVNIDDLLALLLGFGPCL